MAVLRDTARRVGIGLKDHNPGTGIINGIRAPQKTERHSILFELEGTSELIYYSLLNFTCETLRFILCVCVCMGYREKGEK